MSLEAILTLVIGVIVVPSVAWLVKAVLDLRERQIATESWIALKTEECKRRLACGDEAQRDIKRIDRNVARLCQKAGIQEETECP